MKKEVLETLKASIEGVNRILNEDKKNGTIFEVEDILRGITLPNGDKVEKLIFITQDTNQFSWIEANRIVKEESAIIEELASSLEREGNLVPIVINQKREVIDGQRRVTAKKKHQVSQPLRYFFDRDADIREVREANKYSEKWKHRDWLNTYVKSGVEDYKEYEELAAKYEPYMKSRSLRSVLMNGRVESFKRDVWESGEFRIDKRRKPVFIKFLELLKKVYNIAPDINVFAKDREFQHALFDLYMKTQNLDEDRLVVKISVNFGRLNIKTDYKNYKGILAKIYNAKLPEDHVKMSPEVTVGDENGNGSGEVVAVVKSGKKTKKAKEKETA